MALSTRSLPTTTPAQPAAHHPLRSRRVALGLAAAVAAVAATSTGLVLASGDSSPARPADTSSSVPPAYAPGGSVFNQQVPAPARTSEYLPVPPAYAPGGSVYEQQVPGS